MSKVVTLQKVLKLAAAPLALGILSACGGGGGGGVGIADGGIRGTGSSVGPVSGFGSVFVNGVKFETDGQVVSDDGIEREDQLKEGMILRIDGEWRDDGRGDAESVEYDDTFRGPVSGLDASAVESVTFTIYGQTVVADKQTVLNGATLQNLADGQFVRVSAWRQPDGTYRASFIGVIPAAEIPTGEDKVEIEGRIDQGSLDRENRAFTINGQVVSYSDLSFGEGLEEDDLADLLLVEVEGDVRSDGTLVAAELAEGDIRRYRRGSGDDIEFAGPVGESYNAANRTFRINGLLVTIDSNTEFDDGLVAADLQAGLLIQVEGEFQADGSVLAEEIEARDGNASVEGIIDVNTLNPSDQTFRVGGVMVQVTPLTTITDDETDQRLKLADLNGNYQLEVEGIEKTLSSGAVVLEAIKVERNEEDTTPVTEREFELEGMLTEIQGTEFTVLGVPVQTTIETDFGDHSRDEIIEAHESDQPVILEVEYNELKPGVYTAESIDWENDD